MSLESGTTLWRLNQELLPEPGSPIARTTMPFGGRAGAAGHCDGAVGRLRAGAAASPFGARSFGRASSDRVQLARRGLIPFAAAGVKACATACSRPRPPRPRPPRRRRDGRAGQPHSQGDRGCSSGSADFCSGAGSATSD